MSTEFHESLIGLTEMGRISALTEHLSRIPPVPERPTGIILADLDSVAARVVEGLGLIGLPSVAFELERADVKVGSIQDDLLVRLASRTYGTVAIYGFNMQDEKRVARCWVKEAKYDGAESSEVPLSRAKAALDIAGFVLNPGNGLKPN